MMKARILSVVVLSILCCALGACGNTLNGAGRDIERAGQTIQKTF